MPSPNPSSQPISPDLRKAHLLYSLEQADVTTALWPADVRKLNSGRLSAEQLASRADILQSRLSSPVAAALQAGLSVSRLPSWLRYWQPLLLLAAVAFGWFSHQFGPTRLIDILAFPLLGLMVWNLTVCGIFAVHALKKQASATAPPPPADWTALPSPAQEILSLGWKQFSQRETQWLAGARSAQREFWFHLAALLLASGVLGGMYARGFAREYHAGWESTFLHAPQVHTFLNIVLGPAQKLSGLPIPSIPELEMLRLPFTGAVPEIARSYAAPLIHLWAITAGLFIALPRLIMLLAGRAARRRESQLPTQRAEWLADALEAEAAAGKTATKVCVIPIYYAPENRSLETLRPLLGQLGLQHSNLQLLPSLSIGQEEEYLAAHDVSHSPIICLFSLAGTPEKEVHGEILTQLQSLNQLVYVCLDAFSFDDRHRDELEHNQRKAQRLSNWLRVLSLDRPVLILDESSRKNPHQQLTVAKTTPR